MPSQARLTLPNKLTQNHLSVFGSHDICSNALTDASQQHSNQSTSEKWNVKSHLWNDYLIAIGEVSGPQISSIQAEALPPFPIWFRVVPRYLSRAARMLVGE